jgi:hypothetical protein
MSGERGPDIPALLRKAAPLRSIRLRGLEHYHVDDETGKRYEVTVWARETADGWQGWHYKEFMEQSPITEWLRSMWEEVK